MDREEEKAHIFYSYCFISVQAFIFVLSLLSEATSNEAWYMYFRFDFLWFAVSLSFFFLAGEGQT